MAHISNILGTINPIKDVASFVHDHGAMICVDGVAYAPHRLVDVQELDVDFYAFSLYKVYGPHYSLLFGKKINLENLPGMNHFFLEDEIPLRFQPGNVNYELSYGLEGVNDYFTRLAQIHVEGAAINGFGNSASLAYNTIALYEETLSARMLDFLNSKSNVRIIGKKEPDRNLRVPTISFVIDHEKSSSIPFQVDKHLIGIRYGDFYARRLIDYLGLAPQEGVIRVSMVHYNTIDEVDRLIKIFDKLF
jgi:selenocysteine lyase/cysteine desulfurase